MSRRTSLLAVLALLAAPGVALTQPEDMPDRLGQAVEAVPAVDLERYAGTWYEQAHLPLFFQRNCVANTTANYSLRDDGRIDVVNQCDNDKGERIEARAIARKVDGSTSKLEVRFAPPSSRSCPPCGLLLGDRPRSGLPRASSARRTGSTSGSWTRDKAIDPDSSTPGREGARQGLRHLAPDPHRTVTGRG